MTNTAVTLAEALMLFGEQVPEGGGNWVNPVINDGDSYFLTITKVELLKSTYEGKERISFRMTAAINGVELTEEQLKTNPEAKLRDVFIYKPFSSSVLGYMKDGVYTNTAFGMFIEKLGIEFEKRKYTPAEIVPDSLVGLQLRAELSYVKGTKAGQENSEFIKVEQLKVKPSQKDVLESNRAIFPLFLKQTQD